MSRIRAFIDSGPPLREKDINELEQMLGAELPAAYKQFLLSHNGGQPDPPYFLHNVMSRFYSLKVKAQMDSLLANRKRMRKWIPAETIPIASDEFGNEICLAIKGENRGKVYLWDHEGAPASDPWLKFRDLIMGDEGHGPPPKQRQHWPGNADLKLIAESFEALLDSFHDADAGKA